MLKELAVKQANDPPTHEEDPILSLAEVARRLNKSHSTIWRWVHQDKLLKALFVPGTDRLIGVRKSEVNRFLGGTEWEERL